MRKSVPKWKWNETMSALSDIRPDEKGTHRRKIDYVVLSVVASLSPGSGDELDVLVRQIHAELTLHDHNSLFYFKRKSFGWVSDELNDSIQRLQTWQYVTFDRDDGYRLTQKGEEFIADNTTLNQYRVYSDFRDVISDALTYVEAKNG